MPNLSIVRANTVYHCPKTDFLIFFLQFQVFTEHLEYRPLVSTATSEPSFSTMRRLKTYLRSSIGNE